MTFWSPFTCEVKSKDFIPVIVGTEHPNDNPVVDCVSLGVIYIDDINTRTENLSELRSRGQGFDVSGKRGISVHLYK